MMLFVLRYGSINGDPGFLRNVVFLVDFVNRVTGWLNTCSLDFNMLFYNLRLGSEQGNSFSNHEAITLGKESIDDSCFISKDTSNVVASRICDQSGRQNLHRKLITLAMNLIFSAPGSISLMFLIGFLYPLSPLSPPLFS